MLILLLAELGVAIYLYVEKDQVREIYYGKCYDNSKFKMSKVLLTL